MRINDPDERTLQDALKIRVRECLERHSAYKPDGSYNVRAGKDFPILYPRGQKTFAEKTGQTRRNLQIWLNTPGRLVSPAIREAIRLELDRAEGTDGASQEDDEDELIDRLARVANKDADKLRPVIRALLRVA